MPWDGGVGGGWIVGLLLVAGLLAWCSVHDRGLRALARERAGWTVEHFVAHLRARGASPELARDVWTALLQLTGVPPHPSDRPWGAPFHLEEEDVAEALEPVRRRHRVREVFIAFETVEELVLRHEAERVR